MVAQRILLCACDTGPGDKNGLDVSSGFRAEIAENVGTRRVAIAEMMERESGGQAVDQPQYRRAGVTGKDEEHAGIGGGEFVEGVFVFDAQAERGGGRDRR